MTDGIPAVRLDNRDAWNALLPRLQDLVLSGRFTLGIELEEFEEAATRAFGSMWCVGTSSGTSALLLVLRAALAPGSRVALPANTFFATLEAVVAAGHRPVIVDNDPDYVIDLDLLAEIEVDAVIPVHLYGLPADMDRLNSLAKDRGWFVLEDASQAHGASVSRKKVGALGDAAAFSAYPTKNLGAWGDAGFVTGRDPDLEERVRSLRHHGQSTPDVHHSIGGTERMDNLQALVLTEKLNHLDEEVERRRQVAGWYRSALADTGLDLPGDRGERRHVFHQFVIRVPDRDRVRAALKGRGIETSVHYPTPVHLQPGAVGQCEVPKPPRRAEAWAGELLSLPFFPSLSENQVDTVAEALRVILRST